MPCHDIDHDLAAQQFIADAAGYFSRAADGDEGMMDMMGSCAAGSLLCIVLSHQRDGPTFLIDEMDGHPVLRIVNRTLELNDLPYRLVQTQ
jgi:hypothetical protein